MDQIEEDFPWDRVGEHVDDGGAGQVAAGRGVRSGAVIVSHRHRFVFVKTRKTAGTSLEIGLSRLCGPDDVVTELMPDDEELRAAFGGVPPQHQLVPLRRHRPGDLVGLVRGEPRLRFRNHAPASFIERYVGRRVWGSYLTFTIERNPFDRAISRYWWQARDQTAPPALSRFIARTPPDRLSNWTLYARGDSIDVDVVLRYEHLEEDLARLSERLGVEVELPGVRAKGSHRRDRRHYSEVLDEPSRRRIEEVCRREIERFGYHWSEP
jgi:hypothetical protein